MEYVTKGYARKLTTSQEEIETKHLGVLNPNKRNKLRLGFDAAASVNGISLNSVLLKGPDQYQSLRAILFKFREGAVAVVGDIKEMFNQLLIRPQDRQAQRFLWRHGVASNPIETYEMVTMTFGANCSPCSAQFVKNKNAKEFLTEHSKAAQATMLTIMFTVLRMNLKLYR